MFSLRLPALALATLLLALLASSALAQEPTPDPPPDPPPPRLVRDEPPVFRVAGINPAGTLQIVWYEESDAPRRRLYVVRTGLLYADPPWDGDQPLPFYVLYPTPQQYRLGDTLILCRDWPATEVYEALRSCHVTRPQPNAVYLPLVAGGGVR
jgi:hypothetical protein